MTLNNISILVYFPQSNMKYYKYFLLQFIQWFCIFFGFTTIIIDFQKLHLKTSKPVKFYVTFVNLVFLYFIIKTVYYKFWYSDFNKFTFVTLFSYAFIVVILIIFGIGVIILRLHRDQLLEKCLRELLILHYEHFPNYDRYNRNNIIRKLCIINILILIAHSINFIIFIHKILMLVRFNTLIEIYSMGSLTTMQHIIMLHHATILCYIYEFFILNNEKLLNDCNVLKFKIIYIRLCLILKQINKIYSPLIAGLQLNIIMVYSFTLLSFAISILTKTLSFDNWLSKINWSFFILLIIHLIIYFFICDKFNRLKFDTDIIMLQFMEMDYNQEVSFFIIPIFIILQVIYKYLYILQLEQLFLNRCLLQITVEIYDIFKINLSFLFKISAQIIQYLIILLQIYIQASILNNKFY